MWLNLAADTKEKRFVFVRVSFAWKFSKRREAFPSEMLTFQLPGSATVRVVPWLTYASTFEINQKMKQQSYVNLKTKYLFFPVKPLRHFQNIILR